MTARANPGQDQTSLNSGVPLLDLRPQYEAIKSELDQALSRVIESQSFILGPEVEALEDAIAESVGVRYAIGCASGTDALLLTLKAMRPSVGDEVVLPAFTFFATAGAVWNAGFRPVFCDIDPMTFNVTPETVQEVWSERTRAVVPVHLFGQMAPMAGLSAFAQDRGARVLEDAAQAIGARQRAGPEPGSQWLVAGAAGDAGAFSFFPTKNLGGFGEGGLVSTSDPELAERVRKLRTHGGPQMYSHEMVGTNSRLDAIQAAVLRTKLPYLSQWTEARRENACRYHGLLSGLEEVVPPATMDGNVHVYNQYTIRAQRRDELRTHLQRRKSGAECTIRCHSIFRSVFRIWGVDRVSFPWPNGLPKRFSHCQSLQSLGRSGCRRSV